MAGPPEQTTGVYLRRVHDEIQGQLMNDDIDSAVRRWASEQLRAARPLLDRVLRGDEGYEDFLYAYVQREYERTAEDLSDTPYESHRSARLCTCSTRGCSLRHGSLPPGIRMADDVQQGITEFVRAHDGLPVVLVGHPGTDGVDGARGAWSQARGDAGYLLRELRMQLGTEATERPDADPAGEIGYATDADGTPATRGLA